MDTGQTRRSRDVTHRWEVLAQLLALWFSQRHSLEERLPLGAIKKQIVTPKFVTSAAYCEKKPGGGLCTLNEDKHATGERKCLSKQP